VIGNSLRVIAAGVCNYTSAAFFRREGSDFVVGPTQFESADRLQIFRFEIKLPAVFMLRQLKLYELGSRSHSLEARLRFANIFQSNDGITSAVGRESCK